MGNLPTTEFSQLCRDDFANSMVAWNIVRTLASTAAFGCLAWALVLRGRIVV